MNEDLDPVIHAPKRLAAMAILSTASVATFASLRDRLTISESDLSKQMSVLEKAGYVGVTKSGHGRGGVTSYRLTRAGRSAYTRHRAALAAILSADPADPADPADSTG